jgi:hypothetical protein
MPFLPMFGTAAIYPVGSGVPVGAREDHAPDLAERDGEVVDEIGELERQVARLGPPGAIQGALADLGLQS